jgi:Tol biopolymer transport system component
MPNVTADGKWVIYRTENSIAKVSIDGGNSLKLLDKSALYPTISPDGRLLAFFTNERADSQRWQLEIIELASLAPVSRFLLPEAVVPFNGLRWTPDGTGLIYVSNSDGAANLWMQPLKGDGPRQLTDFRDAEILSFAWSPNLRQLACVRNTKTYIPVLIKPF